MSKPLIFSFRNADRVRWYVECERLGWYEEDDRCRWSFYATVDGSEKPVAIGYHYLLDGEEPDKLLVAQVIGQALLETMFEFGRYANLIDDDGVVLSADPPADPAPADTDVPEW